MLDIYTPLLYLCRLNPFKHYIYILMAHDRKTPLPDESEKEEGNNTEQDNVDKTLIKYVTPSSKKTSQSNYPLMQMLKDFDTFADYIINSDYAKNFEKVIKTKQGDKDIQTKVVEKGDIIACLTLGHELGISPMASIALGKQLNSKSYYSVIRGKSLGLDPITSINKIYNIETNNGSVLQMDYTIISSVMTKALDEIGGSIEYVLDFELVPTYKLVAGGYAGHKYQIYTNGKLKDTYFLYIKDVTPSEEIKEAVKEGKLVIYQSGTTRVSALRVVRPDIKLDKTFYYSLQEATDAGLYQGYHSVNVDDKGKPLYIKGRDNWNKHPSTMLRGRVMSISGRIVISDKMYNTYTPDEVTEILDMG